MKYLFGNSQAVEKTFVISDPNVKFVRFKCLKARANETILNYGDVRPYEPYQPYQSNTLTTTEDVTLRAVGDVRDELDCVTGEYVQRIGGVRLDGSEDWQLRNDKTNIISFQIDNLSIDAYTDYHSVHKMICNNFIHITNTCIDFCNVSFNCCN